MIETHASVPWISAEDVRSRASYPAAMHALKSAFGESLRAPARHVHSFGPENSAAGDPRLLLLMPAWKVNALLGVKLVTYIPANAARGAGAVNAVYAVFDATTGVPIALIDGGMLTNIRTASLSALAAGYLARTDARTLLLIGTGSLAPHLALAHNARQRLETVLVWGRRPEAAAATAEALRAEGVNARPVSSVAEGLASADIVASATSSTTPIISFGDVRPGTHIDLVGGFTPEMREVDDETVAHATVVLETIQGVSTTAGDIVGPLQRGLIKQEQLRWELRDLINGIGGRQTADEITLFKSVGDAREDLCVAQVVVSDQLGT